MIAKTAITAATIPIIINNFFKDENEKQNVNEKKKDTSEIDRIENEAF